MGWTILFALMTITGAILTLVDPKSESILVLSMFGLLFVLSLLTRLGRGRAW